MGIVMKEGRYRVAANHDPDLLGMDFRCGGSGKDFYPADKGDDTVGVYVNYSLHG
jgi:hypothetical protein